MSSLYFIISGEIGLYKNNKLYQYLGQNNSFGDECIIKMNKSNFTYVCTKQSEILEFDYKTFINQKDVSNKIK